MLPTGESSRKDLWVFIILIFQLFSRFTFIKIRICRKIHFKKLQIAGGGGGGGVGGGGKAKEEAEDCGSCNPGKRY